MLPCARIRVAGVSGIGKSKHAYLDIEIIFVLFENLSFMAVATARRSGSPEMAVRSNLATEPVPTQAPWS
jgi:hypothetical protein